MNALALSLSRMRIQCLESEEAKSHPSRDSSPEQKEHISNPPTLSALATYPLPV